MKNSVKSITSSLADITPINNQTVVIVGTTLSSAENNLTRLGDTMSNITNTEDLNHLLNEATNHSYQNLQNQPPNLPDIDTEDDLGVLESCTYKPARRPHLPFKHIKSKRTICQIY